ncbi:unnamed protein product [Prunus armeniaca]
MLEVLCKIHDGECGNHAGGRRYTMANVEITLGADPLLRRLSESAIFGLTCAKTPRSMFEDVIDANATSRSLACPLRNTIRRKGHCSSCRLPAAVDVLLQ